jgi:CheY-like chemotaxis protein
VLADATQLHQVLLNLCVNARDAMPSGGKLTVSAQNAVVDAVEVAPYPHARPGKFVRVSVADTGCGIPRENLNRIFEPFFTTKEIGKGTGLGLSTVLGIVKSHQGFVNVYSEIGRGTAFNIYLPADPMATETAKPTVKDAVPRGTQELVLVVDDEPSIRIATQRLLELHGYRVLAAANGQEATARFLESPGTVKLLLTDLMMPGMSGPDLIRALRVVEPKLRVIATSGLQDGARREELAALGVNEILTKPCRPDDLLQAVWQRLHTAE